MLRKVGLSCLLASAVFLVSGLSLSTANAKNASLNFEEVYFDGTCKKKDDRICNIGGGDHSNYKRVCNLACILDIF